MRIEDDELRSLFQTTTEERLQAIDDRLLHLEKHPNDQAAIETILREAHSLKGDSTMLGLKELGMLAHHVETILAGVKRQEEQFSAVMGDRLSQAMQAIRQLAQQAVTGEPPTIHPVQALADLLCHQLTQHSTEASSTPQPPSDRNPPDELNEPEMSHLSPNGDDNLNEPALAAKLADPRLATAPIRQTSLAPTTATSGPANLQAVHASFPGPSATTAGTSQQPYHIETIRVPTHTLDRLMTYAGELSVTEGRITHRLADIQAIAQLHEEWQRDWLKYRSLTSGPRNISNPHQPSPTFRDRTEHYLEQLGGLVKQLQSQLTEDSTRLESISHDLETGIRTLRLLPLSTLFNLFPRLIRDLARQEGKQVELVIEGGDTYADKRILEEMKDPLMHLLRNALDHGIEPPEQRTQLGKPATATIWLRGYQTATNIVLEVSDDGRGLDLEAIQETALRRNLCRWEDLETMTPQQIQTLILSPGFSTRQLVTEISGRGVGLDVLRSKVEALKGEIAIASTPNQGCTFRIQLSTNLAAAHVLLVAVQGRPYALPVETVQSTCLVSPDAIFTIEGRPTIQYEGQPISVMPLATLLELPPSASPQREAVPKALFCVVLHVGLARLGVLVDGLLDAQDVVLKAQSQLLQRVRNVSGATILGDGSVCMVLNPRDLIQSAQRSPVAIVSPSVTTEPKRRLAILLIEDSIATRTQEKRILEAAGYDVVTAVDGVDALSKLALRSFDAIVSDVQMPNMDGLTFTAHLRQQREYNDIPIILVTTLASDDDRRRGAEAGANAYLTKGSFKQDILLETLERLV